MRTITGTFPFKCSHIAAVKYLLWDFLHVLLLMVTVMLTLKQHFSLSVLGQEVAELLFACSESFLVSLIFFILLCMLLAHWSHSVVYALAEPTCETSDVAVWLCLSCLDFNLDSHLSCFCHASVVERPRLLACFVYKWSPSAWSVSSFCANSNGCRDKVLIQTLHEAHRWKFWLSYYPAVFYSILKERYLCRENISITDLTIIF